MENNPDQKRQRLDQLAQSALIIDSKIAHLHTLKTATETEISRLQAEIEPQSPVTYPLPLSEDICQSMLARMQQEVEISCFPVWVTVEYYAEIHSLSGADQVEQWIRQGIVPDSDVLTVGIKLIRDKVYPV